MLSARARETSQQRMGLAACVVSALILAVLATSVSAAPNSWKHPQTVASTPSANGNRAVIQLEAGKTLEETLGGGEKHSYEIQAEAGQFLHVIVEQKGIDVALTLFDPGGKAIASMDSPNGAFGLEQISVIAAMNGKYRLEIAPGDKSAQPGNYSVSSTAPRAPTEADRARISAERIFSEAVQQKNEGSADSLGRAARKFEESLPLWRAASDVYEEALALTELGEVYNALGDRKKALDCLGQALPLWRSVKDQDGEAATLNDIGQIHDDFGDRRKALEYFNQALLLHVAVGDRRGEGQDLISLGMAHKFLGQVQEALDDYNRALLLEREVGDHMGEAVVLNNFGRLFEAQGDRRKALEYYAQALQVNRSIGDRRDEAINLNNMGLAYIYLGEHQKALEYFEQALPLRRLTGDRLGEARTLNNMGLAWDNLGQGQKAIDFYSQALALYQAVGDRSDEGVTLNNIGLLYRNQGDSEKALENFNRALLLHRATGDASSEAADLHNIALIYSDRGETQKALETSMQSLQLERRIGNRADEAITLDSIGGMYARLGNPEKALENYSLALSISRSVNDPKWEGNILSDLMAYWRAENKPAPAIFFGKQAVNKYQEMRANISGLAKETQQRFLKSKEKTYRDLAGLLIAEGRLPEAEQVLDLLKNDEYFEFIRRDAAEASSLSAPIGFTKSEQSVDHEYQENASRVTAIGNEWAALRAKRSRTPEEEKHFAELSEQLKVANEAWGKFLSGLYEEFGKTKQAQSTIENLKESASGMQRVVRALGAGTVALFTLVGEEKYRVFVVTPNVMVAREYPITAAELRKKVLEFRQTLMNPKSDPVPQAQELYKILVGPVAQDIAGAKAVTLMWSLDEVLRYLPVAALHDGHAYLVEKYRNTVFTPANVAELASRPNVKTWQGLGMGVSKSYGQFPALPAVPEELRRVIREANEAKPEGVLPGDVMLDEQFTEASMKKALEHKYPLVHIASHFDFKAGNETNSFLLLGGTDEQGARLTLAEIREDPGFTFADTELLTLSACDTAVGGAESDGREIDGLGILAQQKGAKAVVASLWGVSDASTGLLMQKFYKEWTTHPAMPKAEALRLAQVALLSGKIGGSHASGNRGVKMESGGGKPAWDGGGNSNGAGKANYSHPYYWAPFILIGNWR